MKVRQTLVVMGQTVLEILPQMLDERMTAPAYAGHHILSAKRFEFCLKSFGVVGLGLECLVESHWQLMHQDARRDKGFD